MPIYIFHLVFSSCLRQSDPHSPRPSFMPFLPISLQITRFLLNSTITKIRYYQYSFVLFTSLISFPLPPSLPPSPSPSLPPSLPLLPPPPFQHNLHSELERASCMSLSSKVNFETYLAGSIIFQEGGTGTKFYILLQGETKVSFF